MFDESTFMVWTGVSRNYLSKKLLIELEKAGLKCKAEVHKDVYYEEVFVGKRKLDVIVEEIVLVELKALTSEII
jgi:GxxExxY protein